MSRSPLPDPTSPDPITVEAVHRLLRETTFASAADLVGGPVLVGRPAVVDGPALVDGPDEGRHERASRGRAAATTVAGGLPLPRRR